MITASREIMPLNLNNTGQDINHGEVSLSIVTSRDPVLGDMGLVADAVMDRMFDQPALQASETAGPEIPAAESVVHGEVLSSYDMTYRGDKLGRFVGSRIRGAEKYVTTRRAIAMAVIPMVFIPVPSCDVTRFDVPPFHDPKEWDRKHLKKQSGGTAGNQGNATVCSGRYPFGDLKKQIERRQKCSGKGSSSSGSSSGGGGGGSWNGNCDVFPPFGDLAGRQAFNRNC